MSLDRKEAETVAFLISTVMMRRVATQMQADKVFIDNDRAKEYIGLLVFNTAYETLVTCGVESNPLQALQEIEALEGMLDG